jgi:amino acid transporter
MTVAVFAAAAAYILLALNAASVIPPEFGSWEEYLYNLDSVEGIKGLPTFYAAETAMGRSGMVLLGVTTVGGIVTGLIGNYFASSRLLYTMAEDGLLPGRLGDIDRNNTPRNAIIALMAVSVIIPFFGRTAISWIVDVTTVGAAIAYAYTSAAAFFTAKNEAEPETGHGYDGSHEGYFRD